MSSAHLHIGSFNAGEISPLMGDRFQVEKVASGCRKLRNFIIHPHGPAFRRPGMEYMGAAATDVNRSNLRSFQFSASTVCVLELSTAGLRVWKDGVRLTLLAPVSLPYAADELADVQMCQVNDVVYLAHPSHHPRKLTRYADNDWRIGEVSWKFPPMLDENPGSQALPDQYEVVADSGYDFTQYPELEHAMSEVTVTSSGAFASFRGTPTAPLPHGAYRRLLILRRYHYSGSYSTDVWIPQTDQTWNTNLPPVFPITFAGGIWYTPPGMGGPIVVTASNLFRVYFWGQGWTQFSGGSYVPGEIIIQSGEVIVSALTVAPASFFENTFNLPAGAYKVVVDAAAPPTFPANTRVILEGRVAGSPGAYTPLHTISLANGADLTIQGLTGSTMECRWNYNGFSQAAGTVNVQTISATAPYQTSIAISNATAGTGRALTTNRPVFKPGHVGAYWQLTHRREDAFVEVVSTSAAVAATATLTLAGATVGATVTIGSRVYTWASTVTTVANTVATGATAPNSCANLAAAINAGAGAGSTYGSATAPHADVTAVAVGSTVVVTARNPGKGAHAIPVTETMTNGSWNDVFLSGGVDENTVISAAQTAALRINGKWDVLTYGSWEATLYLERLNAAGTWEFVRSWRANKDRNIAAQGETDGEETLRLRISAGTASESSNAAAPRFMLEAIDGRVDGLVRITSVASSVSATCEVITPCLDTTPTYTWTEGAWSEARGFPRAVTLHESRLWFGGTNVGSMRLWASVTGDIENFRRSSLADASLSFTPSSGELNPIQWLLSQGADLIIGTLGDEWTLNGEGQPVTPNHFSFRPQSRFGSSPVAAIMASEVVVFVQRGGRKVRRISQRSNNEPWSTSDMTVLAEHIAQKGIVQMAFGSNPNAILWAVTSDGKLLGMTLEVEQNVFGWHVHETDGFIESVAVVYGAEADEVWLAVRRGTARSIERLDPQVFARDFAEDFRTMMFCDAAKRFDGAPATVFTGLAHLNGKAVVVLADGVAGTGTVSGGQITLPAAASQVVVGLPFTSVLQPSRLEVQTEKGSAQGMQWRVSRVGAYVHESQGGQVAESPASRFEVLPYPGTALYSGPLETVVESNARRSADVVIQTAAPLPFNLGSLTLKLDLYGD